MAARKGNSMRGGNGMAGLKDYRVAVVEMRRRVVTVAASSEREAHDRVMDAWRNGELVLTQDDFEGAEAHVTGEWEGDGKKYQRIEKKDIERGGRHGNP